MLLGAHNMTDELTHDSFDGVSCNGVLCVRTEVSTVLYPSMLQNMNLDIACISINLLDTQSEKSTYFIYLNTVYTQKNGADSKGNKKFISHLTRAQRTPSAAATVQVSHALPAVRFSCLLRGRGASFQDGVAARKGFLCAPF